MMEIMHYLVNKSSTLKYLGVVMMTMILVSCNTENESDKQDKVYTYYDLEGFIDEQIKLLSKQKPMVTKILEKDGKSETNNDANVDWNKELELFKQADINKIALKSSYIVTRKDSIHYEYKLKEGETALVKLLQITIDQKSGKPALINAHLVNENKLFNSDKNVLMQCVSNNGIWRISFYEIQGHQKLAVFSESNYYVKGILR